MTKPENKKTYLVFILDQSGSMQYGKDITISGFNEQVKILKENAHLGGDTKVSLVTFGANRKGEPALSLSQILAAGSRNQSYSNTDEVWFNYENIDPVNLPLLTDDNYKPEGGTPLYDALGEAIAFLKKQPDINDPNTAVFISAFTDGDENTSKKYTAPLLKETVESLTKTGRWTFALIGARNGIESLGSLLSIKKENRMGFDPSNNIEKSNSFRAMAGATTAYFGARGEDKLVANNLYSPN